MAFEKPAQGTRSGVLVSPVCREHPQAQMQFRENAQRMARAIGRWFATTYGLAPRIFHTVITASIVRLFGAACQQNMTQAGGLARREWAFPRTTTQLPDAELFWTVGHVGRFRTR
jgi:hypothetical protein